MLDMRHTRTVHCVPAGKIKPEMRDGKYVYTEPSRGPAPSYFGRGTLTSLRALEGPAIEMRACGLTG